MLATKCGCNRRTNPIELACASLTSDTSFVAVRAFTKGGVAAGDILTEAQLASDGCLTDWLYSDTSGRFGDGDYERLKKFINDHSAVSADESDPSTSADATSMVAPWTGLPSRSSPTHYYSVAWNYSLSGTARVTASPPSTDETVLMIGLERPDSRSRSVYEAARRYWSSFKLTAAATYLKADKVNKIDAAMADWDVGSSSSLVDVIELGTDSSTSE
eukprot:COSAG06_NODE_128_length_22642_cov_195.891452_1_plen_216_part_10